VGVALSVFCVGGGWGGGGTVLSAHENTPSPSKASHFHAPWYLRPSGHVSTPAATKLHVSGRTGGPARNDRYVPKQPPSHSPYASP